jgi:RNA polymerase sigma factor (sigma-70 family)
VDDLARFGPALCRKARRLLGSAADAEDVVQTVLADLFQRGQATADLPYLFRAVTSRCLNLVRDQTNRQRLIDRQAPALRGPVRTRCDDEVIGTDLMLKLVDRLDPASAEVLVYRYFDDLTQDEIAAMQAVSRKTVAARLERVRQAVRALVDDAPTHGGKSP